MLQRVNRSGGLDDLLERFRAVRLRSLRFADHFTAEDWMLQSMPEASPLKWHLAHTTWFFETMILKVYDADYAVFDPRFHHLFNSYYLGLGDMHARARRGMISRPGAAEVRAYREHVDAAMARVAARLDARGLELFRIGLDHEEQHQELMATDIKHAIAQNPTRPAITPPAPARTGASAALDWAAFSGGIAEIGAAEGVGFDNERPRHKVHLTPFALASRLVTNGEWRAFMEAGGYERPEHWLSDGWDWVCAEKREAPLYWEKGEDGRWRAADLCGRVDLDDAAPVAHVTFYEAAAYADWAGFRLPTEAEWEHAATEAAASAGRFFDAETTPAPARADTAEDGRGLSQMFGDLWEWTGSAYRPYPGFRVAPGAVGEYNGKFMVNQMVLRGGSCATPPDHVRATYRNFFPASAAWQFTGVRLARDL